MTTRDELIHLIEDVPDAERAELVERLKLQRRAEFRQSVETTYGTASEAEPRLSAPWDTIGPAAFGVAVLIGFAAGSVGGQAAPVLAAIGAPVGLLIGGVLDPPTRRRRAVICCSRATSLSG